MHCMLTLSKIYAVKTNTAPFISLQIYGIWNWELVF